jgi:ABC-2 type transport system permease protein
MKVLIAAYYEFLKNLRDIKMFVFIIVSPILFSFILGTVIQNEFNKDSSISISVGYVNKDSGSAGKAFHEFLKQDEIQKRLKVVNFNDAKAGQKALEGSEIDVLIYLPENLSDSLSKDERESIKLYGSKNLEFVETLVNGFTNSYNSAAAIIAAGGVPSTDGVYENSIQRIHFSKTDSAPRAMDYYGVLILLQALVVGALMGVFITTKASSTDLHIRMYSVPVRREQLIFGRIIGSIIYIIISSLITILCTKLMYGVNWSGNPLIIVSTLIVFSIIIIGIGALLGLLIQNYSTSMMLVLVLMMFFGTFSGAITPVSVNNTIGLVIPNYHAKMLLFGTIYGYSKSLMIESALWLLGMTAFIYSALAFFMRRYRYDNI